MATEGQSRMLWAVANAHGLTKPTKEQTEAMNTAEVGEAKTAMESGKDYFAAKRTLSPSGPVMQYSTKETDLATVLGRLADVLERLEKRL